MNPELIELCPNRQLLDSNFDGYKLSLDPIINTKKDFQVPVDRILIDQSQYSYLHAKIYGLHNHLVGETLNDNDSVYFIDQEWNVCKTYMDPFTNELIEPVEVWQIPKRRERKSGDYNVSFKIIDANVAVLSDGLGMLYVLNTGSRSDDDTFKVLYSGEVISADTSFIIVDSVLKEEELHVLLLSIQQQKDSEHFQTVLNWITLTKADDNEWGQIALRELKSRGDLQYAYLAKNCKALYVVSDSGCKFTINSDCPVIEENKSSAEPKKTYKWSQNIEEITVKFPLPENSCKSLVSLKTEAQDIDLKYNGENLLIGKLHQIIDADVTTWTVENNVLEVVLTKSEVGTMWPKLVEGDQSGEYLMDSCIVEEVHNKLGHLCKDTEDVPQSGTTFNSQQIEECDFETDKSVIFERIDCKTNQISHKIHLGTHQVLLTTNFSDDMPPAMGIRHDVDVCLWQPQENGETFSVKHEGTLLAFGYVQASKQQRKFSVCPPDMSYSIICESTRHLFVYRQKKPVSSGDLRNRSTGRSIQNVAQQQVVNLPKNEILGIYASNKNLFLLGDSFVMALKV